MNIKVATFTVTQKLYISEKDLLTAKRLRFLRILSFTTMNCTYLEVVGILSSIHFLSTWIRE